MNDDWNLRCPAELTGIQEATESAGFRMASDPLTGSLLRVLAASKPGGALLELGTGTGLGACWLLSGMDASSTLDSVDHDAALAGIARRFLGHDARARFHVADGATFLSGLAGRQFDLIFADTWPGKFDHLEEALTLLSPGGIYIGDDLIFQPAWPQEHAPKIPIFLQALEQRADLHVTRLAWSTGLVLATKTSRAALPKA